MRMHIKWFSAALLALAWPSLTQAATPAITPRQQQFLDAQKRPPSVYEAWRERNIVLIQAEPQLRRAVVFSGCAKPGAERLLDPTYRAYVETVGGAYYRYLQRPGPASAMANTRALWAIDQMSEAEYQGALRWMTSAETAPLRNARDVLGMLQQYFTESVDPVEGQQNVAVLMAMKKTLVQEGQLASVVKAFAQVDASKAALFESLETDIPLTSDQLSQWYDVAYWLDRSANPVFQAYFSAVPQAWFHAMAQEVFNQKLSQANHALKAYQRRGRVEESELSTLTEEELAGRKIAYYFGDLASDDVAKVSVDAHNDMWAQAQAYIAKHRAEMCSR